MLQSVLPPAGLEVRTGWDHPFRTVIVAGEVDVASANAIAAPLADAIDERPRGVVLDLVSVTFFGASGINTVLTATRRAAARGVPLVVACGPTIARVFDLTGSRDLIADRPSRGAALRALATANQGSATPVA